MSIMYKVWFVAVVFATVLSAVYSYATPSEQCPGESFEDLRDRIQVTPCGQKRCKLPKNSNITVVFKFTPKKVVKSITNEVFANIAGVPLPFIGVDGTDACGDVKRADTQEAVACPLPADQDYVYTNVFPVQPFYPAVNLRVHWNLKDGKKSLICFEVPAVITAGKKN
ncbi:hypothetical protein SFRURICE_000418 [Spodoptera frugiperda]|nr:hypothetical protein SFRURICE_000418 [Spodoptera frugiperda]